MKKRIFTGWTIQRAIYVLLGGIIIAQSVIEHQWPLALAGAYFASMGLFAFGCAAGNCYGGACYTKPTQTANTKIIPIDTDKHI